MTSLSQATTSWELASPSWGLLGHVSHHARWPASLMPKGSWDACTSQGIATFLCAASRHSCTPDEPEQPHNHDPTAEQAGLGKEAHTARQNVAKRVIEETAHIARQPHQAHDEPQAHDKRLKLGEESIKRNAERPRKAGPRTQQHHPADPDRHRPFHP